MRSALKGLQILVKLQLEILKELATEFGLTLLVGGVNAIRKELSRCVFFLVAKHVQTVVAAAC